MIRESFLKSINYDFTNIDLLQEALTHASAVHENPQKFQNSNQRLEFLGDSVLNLIVGNHLYEILDKSQEGSLSKLRSLIVCEKSLAEAGAKFHLSENIILGKNETAMGIGRNPSVVADAMEALIGAVFIDGGYNAAGDFVLSVFKDIIEKALSGEISQDYKTKVQELLQKAGQVSEGGGAGQGSGSSQAGQASESGIEYRLDSQEGPAHDRTFHMSLWFSGEKLGTGVGKTKKEAEQMAAKAALEVKSVF